MNLHNHDWQQKGRSDSAHGLKHKQRAQAAHTSTTLSYVAMRLCGVSEDKFANLATGAT